MSPFDLPPSTPPMGFDPPSSGRRSRKRAVATAVASVGLTSVAVAAIVAVAGDDGAAPVANAAVELDSTAGAPPSTTPTTTPTTTPAPPEDDGADVSVDTDRDGRIVIRIEGQEPIVIDLGELPQLGELPELDLPELGEWGSLPPLPRLGELGELDLDGMQECFDGHLSELEPGEVVMPPLPGVVVLGEDGPSVIEWGEGDGSVTITREDGEVTITSEGDVEVGEPGDLLPVPDAGAFPDLEQLFDCLSA